MPQLKPYVNTSDRSLCQFDCTTFVDVFGSTLLTRQYALPCEQMRADLDALKREHGPDVYVLRSFSDKGNEVGYEVITPAALKPIGHLARVEFWKRREHSLRPAIPAEGQPMSRALFRLAGVVIVPEEKALQEACNYLDYPFSRWNPDQTEGASPAPCYGDVFVITSPFIEYPKAYALTDGYTEIVFTD
jgi:hypothetical protein